MKLDQFLKWQRIVSSGGEAKHLINTGQVLVNGSVELRRGRKMCPGDKVCLGNFELMFPDSEAQGRRLALNDQ